MLPDSRGQVKQNGVVLGSLLRFCCRDRRGCTINAIHLGCTINAIYPNPDLLPKAKYHEHRSASRILQATHTLPIVCNPTRGELTSESRANVIPACMDNVWYCRYSVSPWILPNPNPNPKYTSAVQYSSINTYCINGWRRPAAEYATLGRKSVKPSTVVQ